MSYSLNEIETVAQRAARGAGLDWGIAEEIGAGVHWLAAHRLPGPELLARLFLSNGAPPYRALSPRVVNTTNLDPLEGCGPLCPLITGIILCDHATFLSPPISLGPTHQPLLLAPSIAAMATQTGTTLALAWAQVTLTFSGKHLAITGDHACLAQTETTSVLISSGTTTGVAVPTQTRCTVDPVHWRYLETLAKRTYAPATKESRETGAGAGQIDNN